MDLSKLKDLLKIHVDFSKLKEIHIFSDNTVATPTTYNDNRKFLIINVDPAIQDAKVLEELTKLVPKVVHENSGLVIESVGVLKSDLVTRYGMRGNNICNLCSAGYFETLIKPLYEEMSKDFNFIPDKFYPRYEVIVTQVPFAVFVSHVRSEGEVKSEIVAKIEYNRKYGVHRLNIHGIGDINVRKIRKVIDKISKYFSSDPEIDNSHGYIKATIFY